jgi:tetratricopeptide (TPR) repeat protein
MANKESGRLTISNQAVPLLLISFAVLGVAAGWQTLRRAGSAATAKEAVGKPESCRLVLSPLAADSALDQEIARQQTLVLNDSSPEIQLERLGWIFVKKARLSFDAGFYKLAEQCAACLEARGSRGAETLLLRAHALQSLHHFAEAETAARELIGMRQRPFDYGVLGDILIDEGKVREGAAAYQKMVDLRPDLQSYARAAHVRWLTGDLAGALELMKLATAASSPHDPEAGAWAFTRRALYQLQSGATTDALQSCAAALSMQGNYAPALLVRGRILLVINRTAAAVVELQRAAELNPLPEYRWAFAEALTVAGDRREAAKSEAQIAASANEDPRTISLYLATRHQDVERAVVLAQQELTNRGDVFTHDALAWALAAAGRVTEAQQHIDKALAEHTVDARLFLHAGVIAALNNDHRQARRWLDQAATIPRLLLPSERMLLHDWRQKVGAKK